jgi:hypothetical protein
MGVAIGLRENSRRQLRARAKPSRDAAQTQRLLALAAIGDGASRSAAAKLGGVGLQTRARLGAGLQRRGQRRGPAGADRRQGARQSPAARCRQAPSAGADRRGGADPGGARGGAPAARRSATMGVRPLRDCDQQADAEPPIARPWLWQTVGPAAPPCPGRRRRRDVQKNVFTSLDAIAGQAAPGQPIEVRFQSLPRRRPGTRPVSAGRTRSPGPFDKLRRARRGGRPAAPHDQRTRSAWLFGAICPARGAAAGLVLPRCNIAAMALHLAELSPAVKPGAPAVLLLDQAGWHLSDKLTVPDNITLMPLPPIARAEPGREPLAVHARQSALEPQLPIRRGYPRSLLPRLEQARRPPLGDHLHRPARRGSSLLIIGIWYNPSEDNRPGLHRPSRPSSESWRSG